MYNKSEWGHKIDNKLKYTYESEIKEAPVKEIKMSKEEFDKYIKELEVKNKWKEKFYSFGGCR